MRAPFVVVAGVLAAGLSAAAQAPASRVPALLTSYVEWIEGRGGAVRLESVDLDAVRLELSRIAPTFLTPLEGTVVNLKGKCPSLSFQVRVAEGRIAGDWIATAAGTTFVRDTCETIKNGSIVRAIRWIRASDPAERIEPATRAAIDERHRRLLVTFALDLAGAGAARQESAAGRLTEWACAYVRNQAPPGPFDRAWELAALSLLEGAIEPRTLAGHLAHLRPGLADDPRVVLARGIVEEQLTAPAESVWPDGALTPLQLARLNADRPDAAKRAIARLTEAAQDDSLRAEARLRLGHVHLNEHRGDAALAALADLDSQTDDRSLLYLVHLFRGLAFEGLARIDEAENAYRRALTISPSAHSATMRLAAIEFKTHRAMEADLRLSALLKDDDQRRDPWWSYYAADWRQWYAHIAQVRALVTQLDK